MYITYDEYKSCGGTLDQTAFNSIVYDAQIKLDYYTFGRLKNDTIITQSVKHCMIKIVNLIDTFNQYKKVVTDVNNPVIASQSNDGVSVSFGGYLGHTTPQDLTFASDKLDVDIKNTIKQYLIDETNQAGNRLLYRGVYD